jgi:Flp pilus assembly pilin Flp
MKTLFKRLKEEKGVTTIEYALLIAGVVVIVGILIAVVKEKLPDVLKAIFDKLMASI